MAIRKVIQRKPCFTWFNINPGYNNETLKYLKDSGNSFIEIKLPPGVWDYINQYLKDLKVIQQYGQDDELLIILEFDSTTFRVTVTLKTLYQYVFGFISFQFQ